MNATKPSKSYSSQAIASCLAEDKYIGICGQGPSDYLDFAKWLMEQGIHSISLNPDTVLETWLALNKVWDEEQVTTRY